MGKIEGEIEVDYCPTATMWADGLTKPLQGKMFEDFRNHLMNPGDPIDEGVCCENPNTSTDERRECMDEEQALWTWLRNLHLQLESGILPDPS